MAEYATDPLKAKVNHVDVAMEAVLALARDINAARERGVKPTLTTWSTLATLNSALVAWSFGTNDEIPF